jgi:hypothetical protein
MVALVQEAPVRPAREAFELRHDERRLFVRRRVNASAFGRRLDHSLVAHRQPRINLAIRDLSVSGLSAVSDVPLAAGEHIGVTVSGDAPMNGWNALGRVVRCEPSSTGYRVALEFDPLPAA